MEHSFKNAINNSQSILILLPTKPYFDQVAAALALYLALQQEKHVHIACPTQMIVEFNRLVGIDKITQELGDKNMVIGFRDYRAKDIERVSYDIENSQFKLTVIPKNNIVPPTKEQVVVSYSGISADTVILVGGAHENHFPALEQNDISSAKLIHIGTKDLSSKTKREILSFSRGIASVSEVVAKILKENGYHIDQDISTNLLMGIEIGSDTFAPGLSTPETFVLFAELMEAGGTRLEYDAPNPDQYPPGSIPGQVPQVPQQNYGGGDPESFPGAGAQSPGQMNFVQDQVQQPLQVPAQNPVQAFSGLDVNSTTQEAKDRIMNEQEPEGTQEGNTPPDWYNKPKVYKGSSVN